MRNCRSAAPSPAARRLLSGAALAWLLLHAPLGAQGAATARELARARNEVPELLEVLELTSGMTVADVGAGFGATSLILARALGPTSVVYATDAGLNALAGLRAMVAREKLPHLVVVEGTVTASNLPAECCDAVFLRDVYHHLSRPGAIIDTLRIALKPGGRLAIIDFEATPGSVPPPGVPASRSGHGIAAGLVVRELVGRGFIHDRTLAPWPRVSGNDFYLVLFRKPDIVPTPDVPTGGLPPAPQ